MGMIVYHKISVEITGPDGREWLVEVEPPTKASPPGVATLWEAKITQLLTREELAQRNGVPAVPHDYTIPTMDGMFSALNTALSLVPARG
jgi:hypothetical protein